jgi:hypothetical protein
MLGALIVHDIVGPIGPVEAACLLTKRLGHSDPAYMLRNYLHLVKDGNEERRLID